MANNISTAQHRPIADAGSNKFAIPNTYVKLNASNSTDLDGDRLTYQWTVISKPKNSTTKFSTKDKVAPELYIDKPGVYQIELWVTDGKLHSSSIVEINTVETQPVLPKIHAQKVIQNQTAYLSADSAYDPDGDFLNFEWVIVNKPKDSQAQLSDKDTIHTSIVTDVVGRYVIRLEVDDGKATKSQNIHVFAVENAQDSINPNHALKTTDQCIQGRLFYDSFEITVPDSLIFGNSQPVALIGEDQIGVLGQQMLLDGSASFDLDNDTLMYQWSLLSLPVGSTASIVDPANQITSFTPDLVGDYVAQLIVSDTSCGSDPDSALMTISVNQAPQILSIAVTTAIEASNYSYQVVASDPENHDLSYSLSIAPVGMNIDISGLITWVALTPNTYAITVDVVDEYGASTSQSFDVAVSANQAPKIESFPISSGEKDFSYSYQLSVSDAEGDVINYTLTNSPPDMTINSTGLLSWTPDTAGTYPVTIQVDDGFGAVDTQSFDLDIIELPPNPNDIAPALSKTEYTPFPESISFLYENNPPVQIGMPADTIQDYRVAVITGKVLDQDNNPIQGIKVSINNHDKYGHTYTRDNGVFFMVVNGGGTVTVNFTKGGYLPVQRDIKTPWQEFAYVDDLIIVRLDDKVTSIDLTDVSQPYQVAQGNIVTDMDGTRQATLLFRAGTTATMTMPDGSTQAIDQLDVRATEYTVGENGPQKMPADLPAGSGYTYAVELSVDQAIEGNATRVDFSQEVVFYLDDFIGFPAGVAVPTGWYDKQQAHWIPSDNGIVVKIIGNYLAY